MVAPKKTPASTQKRRAKATTPEGRENQLVAMAYDLAEEQFRDKTASAMVVVHFLKLRTGEQKLKEEKLRKENLLLEARTSALGSSKDAEEKYDRAIKAIHSYQGREEDYEDL